MLRTTAQKSSAAYSTPGDAGSDGACAILALDPSQQRMSPSNLLGLAPRLALLRFPVHVPIPVLVRSVARWWLGARAFALPVPAPEALSRSRHCRWGVRLLPWAIAGHLGCRLRRGHRGCLAHLWRSHVRYGRIHLCRRHGVGRFSAVSVGCHLRHGREWLIRGRV